MVAQGHRPTAFKPPRHTDAETIRLLRPKSLRPLTDSIRPPCAIPQIKGERRQLRASSKLRQRRRHFASSAANILLPGRRRDHAYTLDRRRFPLNATVASAVLLIVQLLVFVTEPKDARGPIHRALANGLGCRRRQPQNRVCTRKLSVPRALLVIL